VRESARETGARAGDSESERKRAYAGANLSTLSSINLEPDVSGRVYKARGCKLQNSKRAWWGHI